MDGPCLLVSEVRGVTGAGDLTERTVLDFDTPNVVDEVTLAYRDEFLLMLLPVDVRCCTACGFLV